MNNNINIINMDKEEIIESYKSECNSIFCINYYDDNKISYGSKDGSICFLDLIKKKNIYRYEEIGDCINYCTSSFSDNCFYNSNINNNNDTILMNPNFHIFSTYKASDCLIKKYDMRYIDENKPLDIYVEHTSPIRYISFSKDFSYFTTSSDNGSIKLWSVNKKKEENENKIYSSFNNLISPSSAFSFDLDSPVNDSLKVKKMNMKNKEMPDKFVEINKQTKNKTIKQNKTISHNNNNNMRSSSIISDTNYYVNNLYDTTQKKKERKNIFSKKYENILLEFQKKKRTITPNTILSISNEKKKKSTSCFKK
ncbi:WD domain-containing protein [Plasmodium falciparum RAJ116]|uniref:WD domain-containing protein n=1 Tax=Plasmodium falciparum RAJ116 TaxID=580058 RepID=A0A0L0D0B9_PLAFA|nr:WD domain-containing protein [Plasmodium falciparum RAJ116]